MEEKKKRKSGLIIFILLLIIALLVTYIVLDKKGLADKYINLSFLNSKQKTAETSEKADNKNEIEEKETKSIKIDDDEEYVYDGKRYDINQDIKYEDKSVYEFKGSILVPYININTEDAKKIKEDINKMYEDAVSSIKVEKDESGMSFDSLNYKTHINKEYNTLAIIISKTALSVPGDGFNDDYIIYNFDLNTGKLLSNEELLGMINKTKEDITVAVDKCLKDGWKNYSKESDEYSEKEYMKQTERFEDEIFIDRKGKLNIHARYTYPIGEYGDVWAKLDLK